MKKLIALALIFLIIFAPAQLYENNSTEHAVNLKTVKDIQDKELHPTNNGSDKYINNYIPIILLLVVAICYQSLIIHYLFIQRTLTARFYQSNYLILSHQ
ncbi:hypothetical protein [Gracilibacillus xinjiangensis]|uniref:Uncharacterized protein n=1 Tax=Gracilibacillus xinjiangensis TaxID=1193282 RepID=A0ABV8WT44_9BACI